MNKQYTPDELREAKKEAVKLLLRPNGNVVGVGIGKKEVKGKPTGDDCVRIYVVSKLYVDDLSRAAEAPSSVLGVPTDIIEIGRFGRRNVRKEDAKQYAGAKQNGDSMRKDEAKQDAGARQNGGSTLGSPIRVETNAPNVNSGSTGTLGAVVRDDKNKYILSCNHVLAANGRVPEEDDPKEGLRVGIVSAEFVGAHVKIADPGPVVRLEPEPYWNTVDCALALLPKDSNKVKATFREGDITVIPADPIDPQRDMSVSKVGAASGPTVGKIVDVDAALFVDYSFGTFGFDHQIMIDGGEGSNFAIDGDSGAIVVDRESKRATAMIFAETGRFAVACPLSKVREELKKKGVGTLQFVQEEAVRRSGTA
jgi:hypothetical protein